MRLGSGVGEHRKHRRNQNLCLFSYPLLSRGEFIALGLEQREAQKEMVEEIKTQWRSLWHDRVDDKVRAEGVASGDYSRLFVEKGTIIHATRKFKALSFKEILEQNQVLNAERFVPPSPHVGGWSKFIKTSISVSLPLSHRRAASYVEPERARQQPRKGGRGWLHK